MGNKQTKPKGRYLHELHQKVPNMNIEEILLVYEDFRQQSGGRNRLSKRDFVRVYNSAFHKKGNSNNQLAENIFQSFDTDNSGFVDFEEFLIGLSITEGSALGNDKDARMKKLEWAFSVYDKDNSGTIDMSEMRLIVKAVAEIVPDAEFLKGKSHRRYADALFNSVDANGDGEISFKEFVAAAEKDETLIDLLLPAPT